MGALDGRVVAISGAGRGIGRAYALYFAAEGARIVVNDVGGDMDGSGGDQTPAEEVVAEIRSLGGEAVANHDDVGDWDGGRRFVEAAVESFGDLHVLVNNAGILRDRAIVNMTMEEWDAVMHVHLRGHFVPTRFAANHWRDQSKAAHQPRASIINTSSTSGLLGNPGQANYGAAKAGIAAFTVIAAQELSRYGVRVNCLAPAARTRLTESTPGLADVVAPPAEGFDEWDPANIPPVAAYLALEDCPLTGKTIFVRGGTIQVFEPWRLGDRIDRDGAWSLSDLQREMKALLS